MTRKLSEIIPAPSAPVAGDTIVGVLASGPTDVRFSVPQIFSGASAQGLTRTPLSSSTTYYVRATGNDSNDGLTPGTAWLTLAKAINYLNTQIDVQPPTLALVVITIDIGAGTFAGVTTTMDFSNSEGGALVITGAGVGSTIITDGISLYGSNAINVTVQNMTLQATAGTPFGLIQAGGILNAVNCAFALFAGMYGIRIAVSGTASAISASNCSVSGTGAGFVVINDNTFGHVALFDITYDTPTFTYAVFDIGDDGHVVDDGTNAGSATGRRYVCNGRLTINYGGGSIQSGVGTIDGVIGQIGQVQDSNGFYHTQPLATQKAGAPAVSDLVNGAWGVFKDTVAGTVVIAYNDGGIIRTAILA